MSPVRPPSDPGSPVVAREAYFLDLEQRRTRALVTRDMATIDALHAPEYELVTPSGRVFSRAEYLAAIEREPFYAGWDIGPVRFQFGGDLTALRYQATLLFPSGRQLLCWHLDLYQQRQDRWQAVWSQATELRMPAADSPTDHVSPGTTGSSP